MRDEAKKGEGVRVGWARPVPLGANTAEKDKRETVFMTMVS